MGKPLKFIFKYRNISIESTIYDAHIFSLTSRLNTTARDHEINIQHILVVARELTNGLLTKINEHTLRLAFSETSFIKTILCSLQT